jgi:iron complex outermembrane receptor protein
VTANYDYYFRQDEFLAAAGTELPNAAYGLLGASAGVTFADRRGKPWATLMVTAQNLTDEVYQNHLSRLRYAAVNNATGRRGIFSPGMNVGVRLVVPL